MKVAHSCLTLCDPMDYTIHGILQARILEGVAFPFSKGIFPTQGSNPGLLHCRRILYKLSHKGSANCTLKTGYYVNFCVYVFHHNSKNQKKENSDTSYNTHEPLNLTLSETHQSQKGKYSMIPHTWWTYSKNKVISWGQRLVEGSRELLFNEYKSFLFEKEKIPEMNGGVNCRTVQIHLMPLNCILLNVFLNGKFLKTVVK